VREGAGCALQAPRAPPIQATELRCPLPVVRIHRPHRRRCGGGGSTPCFRDAPGAGAHRMRPAGAPQAGRRGVACCGVGGGGGKGGSEGGREYTVGTREGTRVCVAGPRTDNSWLLLPRARGARPRSSRASCAFRAHSDWLSRRSLPHPALP